MNGFFAFGEDTFCGLFLPPLVINPQIGSIIKSYVKSPDIELYAKSPDIELYAKTPYIELIYITGPKLVIKSVTQPSVKFNLPSEN